MLEGKKILIVEDEERTLKSYKYKFSTREEVSKVIVKYAVNPQEAKNIIENDHPDLIYLDLSLGESAIPEGIFMLREYAKRSNIIVVSGYGEQMATCLAIGAKGFLLKPFDFIKMIEEGEKVLKINASIEQRK